MNEHLALLPDRSVACSRDGCFLRLVDGRRALVALAFDRPASRMWYNVLISFGYFNITGKFLLD